jgi:hypothetical protein
MCLCLVYMHVCLHVCLMPSSPVTPLTQQLHTLLLLLFPYLSPTPTYLPPPFLPHTLTQNTHQAGATSVTVKLPKGATWYDAAVGTAWTGTGAAVKQSVSMDRIPVFYRGGAIVPRR